MAGKTTAIIADAKKKQKKDDKQWQFSFLIEQFSEESDRAAVILVASIIDENLTTLLKSYFVPNPTANDALFDSATSPLSNFSSKIDMAFRIGLISGKLARDMHIVRKIRNAFAHNIYGCSFEDGSVKSRIRELENSSSDWLKEMETLDRKDDLFDGTRGKFLFITAIMVWVITESIEETKELSESKLEWFYTDEGIKSKK